MTSRKEGAFSDPRHMAQGINVQQRGRGLKIVQICVMSFMNSHLCNFWDWSCAEIEIILFANKKNIFFSLSLALLRRTYFLPPSMVHISVIITHITNYNLFTCWTSVGSVNVLHLHLLYCCQPYPTLEHDVQLSFKRRIYWMKNRGLSKLSHHGWIIQLLIFIEKFSPLPGFELGTSPVPSRYATNWAILAWIFPIK